MFDNKKEKASETNPESAIHTMRDDLKGGQPPAGNVVNVTQNIPREPVSNPFSDSNQAAPKDSWNKDEKKGAQKEVSSLEKAEIKTPHRGLGKVLIVAVVISILLLVAAGGYYFWMTRMDSGSSDMPMSDTSMLEETANDGFPDQTIEMTNEMGESQNETQPSIETETPDFSQDSLNYLSLDMQNSGAVEIKAALTEKAADVLRAAPSNPIKFQITDTLNSPVSFSDFSDKAGLSFSQAVFDQLGNDFKLYAFFENNTVRWGLEIAIYDSEKLQNALNVEESGLPKLFAVFYPEMAQAIPDNFIFNSSQYNGQKIRYANFYSSAGLSLDYTVSGKKIVFGTSRMALRSIWDFSNGQEDLPSEMVDMPMER